MSAMTAADRKRLAVLRNILNVYDTADGIRLYENVEDSRSVREEVQWLLRRHLIETWEREDGHGYRTTDAGRVKLDAWKAPA